MSKKTQQCHINVNGLSFVNHGRKEVTDNFKKQAEKFKIGSLVAYETNNGRYTKGGFVTEFCQDYLVWITLDFEQSYKIRYKNVKRMWLGDVFKVESDYVAFKKPDNVTNYEVKIGNYPVKYFKNSRARNLFLETEKYKTMVKWHDYFIDSSN